MSARFTSKSLAVRVEDGPTAVLLSATHGASWVGLTAYEARSMGQALCEAAEHLAYVETEAEHAA